MTCSPITCGLLTSVASVHRGSQIRAFVHKRIVALLLAAPPLFFFAPCQYSLSRWCSKFVKQRVHQKIHRSKREFFRRQTRPMHSLLHLPIGNFDNNVEELRYCTHPNNPLYLYICFDVSLPKQNIFGFLPRGEKELTARLVPSPLMGEGQGEGAVCHPERSRRI